MLVQSPLGIVHHAAPIPEYGHTCHAFHIDHFRDHDRIARTVMKIRQAGLAIHREGTKADTGRVERVPVTPQRANARVRAVIAPRVVSSYTGSVTGLDGHFIMTKFCEVTRKLGLPGPDVQPKQMLKSVMP